MTTDERRRALRNEHRARQLEFYAAEIRHTDALERRVRGPELTALEAIRNVAEAWLELVHRELVAAGGEAE